MKIVLFLSVLLYLTLAQDDLQVEEADIRHQSNHHHHESHQKKPEKNQDSSKSNNQMQLITCTMITQQELLLNPKIIQEIQSKYKQNNKPKIVKKITAELLIECMRNMNEQKAKEAFELIKTQKLNQKNFNQYLGNFKWSKYQNKKINVKLTDIEKKVIQFIEDFEKQMADQRKKFGFDNANFSKIMNNDIQKLSNKLYLAYGIVFIIIIMAGVFYCIYSKSNLDKEFEEKLQERKKVEDNNISSLEEAHQEESENKEAHQEDSENEEKSEIEKKND